MVAAVPAQVVTLVTGMVGLGVTVTVAVFAKVQLVVTAVIE